VDDQLAVVVVVATCYKKNANAFGKIERKYFAGRASFRFSQDLVTVIDGHVPIWVDSAAVVVADVNVVIASVAAAICKCANYVPKAHCLQRLATAAKINNYKYANGARIAAVDAAVVVVVAAATAVVVDSFIHKNRA